MHLMSGGEPEKAVALLHEAASGDVGGQIAARMWGAEHPYRSLWPDRLDIDLDIPIPASVSAILGWNRLPGTHPSYSNGRMPQSADYPPSKISATQKPCRLVAKRPSGPGRQ